MSRSPSTVLPQGGSNSSGFDDDGRPKRTGTTWTASVHILTTVIGSGILSLAWSTAQLGWIAGPAVMFLFSFVTYYTSTLLSACYRSGDDYTGERNYTYMDTVRSNLGGSKRKIFGVVYYTNVFGVAIGYTMASSASMIAILRSICSRSNSREKNPQMIVFGVLQFIFSQIPDSDLLWILTFVSAITSFTYSTICLGLSIAKVAESRKVRGSIASITLAKVTATEKIWRRFQALGDIAFAYSFSSNLIEIEDTVKSPPSEAKTMKKATRISLGVTTLFYILCGCFGYAAFGDSLPLNFLAGFGCNKPYTPVDVANAAVVLHLIGSYQVHCRPLFKFVETTAAQIYPDSKFITRDFIVTVPGDRSYNLNLFRLVWRTIFVIITIFISVILPFSFEGFLGAWGFWPLTVYFPVEIYIAQKKITKWSRDWIWLQILNFACLIITVAAAGGCIAGIALDLKS